MPTPRELLPVAVLLIASCSRSHATKQQARIQASTIRDALIELRADAGSFACASSWAPVDNDAVRRWSQIGYPDAGLDSDPWHHSFWMRCTRDDISVASAGPDGTVLTSDDVVVP